MLRSFIFQIFIFVGFGSLLFISAGTLHWPAAWVLIVEMGGGALALHIWLARHDPRLLKERWSVPFQSTQPRRDKVLVAAFLLCWSGMLPIMGFDAVRYRWSHVPIWLQTVGAILVLLNAVFNYLTFRENPYASGVVKIQTDAGHRVITTGMYAHVRHPLYAGFILFFVGAPLLLGSWYGLIGAVLSLCILCTRVALEEQTLAAELAGYRQYAERVRYRLIPGVW